MKSNPSESQNTLHQRQMFLIPFTVSFHHMRVTHSTHWIRDLESPRADLDEAAESNSCLQALYLLIYPDRSMKLTTHLCIAPKSVTN